MNGAGHRLAGACAGASWALATVPYSWSVVAMSAAVSSATSHGWMSPDLDLTRPWRLLQRATPEIDGTDPTRHRGATHWPLWPLIAWYATGGWTGWDLTTAHLLILGWTSHVLADAVFGTVPLTPWGTCHIGLGLATGGATERVLVWGPLPLLLLWLLVGAPTPGGISW